MITGILIGAVLASLAAFVIGFILGAGGLDGTVKKCRKDSEDAIKQSERHKGELKQLCETRDKLATELRGTTTSLNNWMKRGLELSGVTCALRARIKELKQANESLVKERDRVRAENRRVEDAILKITRQRDSFVQHVLYLWDERGHASAAVDMWRNAHDREKERANKMASCVFHVAHAILEHAAGLIDIEKLINRSRESWHTPLHETANSSRH